MCVISCSSTFLPFFSKEKKTTMKENGKNSFSLFLTPKKKLWKPKVICFKLYSAVLFQCFLLLSMLLPFSWHRVFLFPGLIHHHIEQGLWATQIFQLHSELNCHFLLLWGCKFSDLMFNEYYIFVPSSFLCIDLFVFNNLFLVFSLPKNVKKSWILWINKW